MFKVYYTVLICCIFCFTGAYATSDHTLARVITDVKKSVVSIEVDNRRSRSQSRHFFNRLFAKKSPSSHEWINGSGLLFEGYVITNEHVIKNAKNISVVLFDKTRIPADVIAYDAASDIAVLKPRATNEREQQIIKSYSLPRGKMSQEHYVGQSVFAIGSPYGLENTVTRGIISATNRELEHHPYTSFIQTDVAINPGSSGGPLFSVKGKCLGINSQIMTQTGSYSGISFAIPTEMMIRVARELIANGQVQRGWLGATFADLDYEYIKKSGMVMSQGAAILTIEKDSPAANYQLKENDVILNVNTNPVSNAHHLSQIIAQSPVNEELKFTLQRGDALMSISVELEPLSH